MRRGFSNPFKTASGSSPPDGDTTSTSSASSNGGEPPATTAVASTSSTGASTSSTSSTVTAVAHTFDTSRGIGLDLEMDEDCRVQICGVAADAQAAAFGIEPGWWIASVDGASIESGDEVLARIEAALAAGASIELRFLRAAEASSSLSREEVGPLSTLSTSGDICFDGRRKIGVDLSVDMTVIGVDPEEQAAAAGIQVGWHLTEIEGSPAGEDRDMVVVQLKAACDAGVNITIRFEAPDQNSACAMRAREMMLVWEAAIEDGEASVELLPTWQASI